MARITLNDKTIECEPGENLRKVLLKEKLPLYNGASSVIHCRGFGTCGTCAIRVSGEVTPMTRVEKWRLGFPPFKRGSSLHENLRLACQCEVVGDLELEKLDGLWGSRPTK